MSDIVEKMKSISDLGYVQGADETQIQQAQSALGMTFPQEYIDYVKAYGCIDFGATEWTGLNVNGYLNTVEATKKERLVNPDFPMGYFVLDDYFMDGKKIVVNEKGEVYLLQYETLKKVCDTISQYLDICIRKNG